MAPPAAPTAAPTTAPTAASFTTSAVLSRSPVCEAAYRLQASTAACGGIVDRRAAPGAGGPPGAVLTAGPVAPPTPVAPTRPGPRGLRRGQPLAIARTVHRIPLPALP